MEAPSREGWRLLVQEMSVSAEVRVSAEVLAAAVGISPGKLARLVRLGVVEPTASGEFAAADVLRLRRILRLQADLGVNLVGAAIITDLLERLARLETELRRSR